MESSLNGAGWVRSFDPGNPAAGAEFNIAVTTGVLWKFLSFYARLLASGVAGVRSPSLLIAAPSGAAVYRHPSTGTVAAGPSIEFSWSAGGNALNVTNVQSQGFPGGIILPPGYFIRTQTVGLLAGDQWAIGQVTVEQFVAQ